MGHIEFVDHDGIVFRAGDLGSRRYSDDHRDIGFGEYHGFSLGCSDWGVDHAGTDESIVRVIR